MNNELLSKRIITFWTIILMSMTIVGIMFSMSMIYQTQDKQAKATIAAIPTMTAEALEFLYQKGLGYINIGRWQDAKVTLEAIFEVNPNYKDVQTRLVEVETEVKKLSSTPIVMPTASPTFENVSLSKYGIIELNITPQEPVGPVNIPTKPSVPAKIVGDLAWNKPTFASSYWEDGYPSGATSGKFWRSAGSTQSWFYVDLGKAEDIYQIVTTLFVDGAFSTAPRTTYIVSNDLRNWQVVVEETNHQNSSHRGQPRVLTLPENVKVRYVGFYATGWDGGWADQSVFAVLPPNQPFQR